MSDLPRKLKTDAIVEALLEVRFEHRDLWEVVVGRMVSAEFLHGCQQTRLPVGDMPPQLREMDPNLRYQPTIQLQRSGLIVKLGPYVMSVHIPAPYPGWALFSPMIKSATEALFGTTSVLSINRLGLRYINALWDVHGITSTSDLQLEINVAGSPTTDFALMHRASHDPEFTTNVSIATKQFVAGNIPPQSQVFVDIDVFNEKAQGAASAEDICAWVDAAHEIEKQAFFSLLREETISQLREE